MKCKICTVFAAGEITDRTPLPADSLLIAADGGLKTMSERGLVPHYVLGDFDSLGYVPSLEGVTVYPKEKDDTDTMLAARLALEQGCEKPLLYGGLGGAREDHGFANLSALSWLSRHGVLACAAGRGQSVFALRSSFFLPPSLQGTVSIFAFGGEAEVSIEGLKYPYEGTLSPHFPLGVSNEFIASPARIHVSSGTVLLFLSAEPEALIQLLEENRV
jgi:thiamine pyrophosphokinase